MGGDSHSWQQGPWPAWEAQPGPAEELAGTSHALVAKQTLENGTQVKRPVTDPEQR